MTGAFSLVIDVVVLQRCGRWPAAILVSYVSWVLVILVFLTIGSVRLAASGVFGMYAITSFLLLRGSAELYQSDILHWKSPVRSESGLAVTSVLILDRATEPRRFMLIRNENLNNGRGLWVSPGGRWNPSSSSPEGSLMEKIEREVNLKSEIYRIGSIDEITPVSGGLDSSDCRWFRAPHFLLYENLSSERADFPLYHLDLVYVCRSDGSAAGRAPKYGPAAQILLPVESCAESFDAAHNVLSRAVDDWYLRTTGQRPAKRDEILDDVVWRLHLIARAFDPHQTQAAA
jgi:hypothetical protein